MAATSNPFAAPGTWLRCALHAHTTRSDGELSPEELVSLYERAGFDVLAITDHWVRTEARSTDRLLVIPSSELSCRLPGDADGHLLALGIFGISADYSHHAERDSGFAWVWTCVVERSAAAVLDALASGRFYSSTGPVLDELHLDGASVEVSCSPCRRVTLCTGRKRGTSVSSGPSGYRYGGEVVSVSDDAEITRVRLERPPRSPYGRLELVDRYGRKAWTNPLWG